LEFVPKTIICVSKDLKNYYNGNDKYIVIPNGFNLNINYDKNNKKIIRKAHKINNNEVVFGIASTFAPWKGIEFLIEGFYNALLKIETQNIKLLIAGSVDKDSNNYSYFLKLKKIVNDLSLNDKVYFVGWQDNIYNFIDSCDVIVSSSISDSGGPESFGRTIIEAWLLKKPVIATRSGGPKYIINNFYNGIFVKEKDSLEITNAIIYLAQKEERRIKMGLNGYKSVKDKYDLNKISDKYNEIIQKL
jgi:glycosyltransferase involved in cell wall biosynthesis